MSYFMLKCLALLLMLLDHIGFFLGISGLRIIGRLSFPIFAFLISNGLRHTKSPVKYGLRLLIFAIISEIPYDLFVFDKFTPKTFDNIFFTLFLGLSFLIILKQLQMRFKAKRSLVFVLSFLALSVICIIAALISCDYGYIGVLTVIIFGLFEPESRFYKPFVLFGLLFLSGWSLWSYLIYTGFNNIGFDLYRIPAANILFSNTLPSKWNYSQFLRMLAVIPIFLYNGKSGQPKNELVRKSLKYGFYLFYPLHILIIYFIGKLI